MLWLRHREEMLLAQVLNEESLARNADEKAAKYRRQAMAYALELEKVQRQQIAAASPQSLMNLSRRTA